MQKKAADLKVGDKILGNTNHYKIVAIRPSPLTGRSCPIIDVVDAGGNSRSIDTGATERLQDHLYEVEAGEVKESQKA